ncbi:hypothetical protein [Neptuniibacter sp.]|uniref:hypothetical protein n=1 Tax=Neptuniibacter sp. TaxID=1962643 RepID=UPI002613B277|nr:hypothetical protein [Neptuniibacter sp.]MCP4597019.1 hypothetical protein [Neptuniibacter sp.]
MANQNVGINYAGKYDMTVNRDAEAGIRFGVIHQNEVMEVWCEESEAEYGVIECSSCGDDLSIDMDECPNCEADLVSEFDFAEPIAFSYIKDGYKCFSNEYGDIFIEKAPYYTYAQFCSPCAPGACHLSNPLDMPNDNNKCYCFGHDWFDNEKAPYPVYDVETGQLV